MQKEEKVASTSYNMTQDEKNEGRTGLTWRATIIGAIVIVLGAYVWLDILYENIWGMGFRLYWVYYDAYAPNNHALVPILLIGIIINPILRLLRKRRFTEKELLVINNMSQFSILLIALFATLIPAGMMGLSLPVLWQPNPYSSIAKDFSSVFFIDSDELMRWFQEGPGPVPWSKWLIPFIAWTSFILVLVALFFCVGTLLRRRWTDEERLRYPIGEVKLAYIRGCEDNKKDVSLWKNKFLWIGVGLAFLFSAPNYLTTIWQWMPDTSMEAIRKLRNSLLEGNASLQTAFYLTTMIHPVVMSALWFVELDLLFSTWFFYIFRSILNLIFMSNMSMGLLPGNPETSIVISIHTAIGAQVALALVYLWISRRTLLSSIKKGLFISKYQDIDDSNEPMSYKTAVWGSIGCLIFFVVFCNIVLKMSLLLSLIIIIFIVLMGVALARMRDEAGIGAQYGTGDWPILTSFLPLVGSKNIGYSNAGFGAFNNIFAFPFFCYLGGFLESWKIGDELGEKRKTVMKSIWLSLFFTVIVLAFIFIPYMYKIGFNKTVARNNRYALYWGRVANALREGTIERDPTVLFWYVYSFITVLVLGWLRTNFTWWPLHPVGFVTGGTVWADYFVDMAFIVWIVKALIMKYGGYSLYKKITPIFLGLGVGQILASLVGLFVSTLQLMRII